MLKKLVYIALVLFLLGIQAAAGCQISREASAQTGTLNLYGVDPLTLDPANASDATSHQYIQQIFSGLVKFDDDLNTVPDMAERWETSEGGRTYTFYLRRDVHFHGGRQVTAEDFKYSWERACNPATRSQVASTFLGDIVGAEEVLAGRAAEISGLEIVDDFTMRVTIDQPRSYFLFKLSFPVTFVVDRNNVRQGEWWRTPNGTGPFELALWEAEETLTLKRNDDYYGQKAGVQQVVFSLWGGVPMNLYETGEIDVTGVSATYIDRVTDPAGPFYDQLKVSPELSFHYLGFNPNKPPFDDVDVRRAFTMAVDKEKIVRLVYRNLVQEAKGILPPGIPGFNPDLEGLPFDPQAAREAIAASSYASIEELPAITITTSGYGGYVSSALEAIIEEWRRNLGVEVTVRQLEPQRYIYNLKEEKDEMFFMGWIADYPHPQDFLEVLFGTGSEANYAEYSNPAVDGLLREAGVETDLEASLEMYRRAEQMLVEDAACLPLTFGENYILVKPHVNGYELNPMGYARLNQVSVE